MDDFEMPEYCIECDEFHSVVDPFAKCQRKEIDWQVVREALAKKPKYHKLNQILETKKDEP